MRVKFTQCVLSLFVILASATTYSMGGLLHGPVRGDAVTSTKGSIIVYREKGGDTQNTPAVFVNGNIIVASLLPDEYAQTRVCSNTINLQIATRGNTVAKGQSKRIDIPKDSITYVKVVQTQNKTFAPIVVDEAEGQKALGSIKTTSNIINRYIPKIVLGTDSLFGFDSTELLSSARATMDKLVRDISMCPNQVSKIKVTGHTDRIGSDAYNDDLSLRRALAIADYLDSHGINIAMEVEGHGSREPVTTNCKGARSSQLIKCLQPDRRVVIEY